MRGAPLVLAGACMMTGCLGLLGGDGVPTPIDAGRDAPVPEAASDHSPPEKPAGAAIQVSSGADFQNWCVVTEVGDVLCWGDNEVGELGDGTTVSSATPVKVKGLPEPVTQVTVGFTFVCALTKSGGVFCWGLGAGGELGNGKKVYINRTPQRVIGLDSGVISLSAGNVACAVKKNGSAWCWGYGQDTGILGNATMLNSDVPVPVTGLDSGVTSVSVGDFVACAVQRGHVLCWGAADHGGELGNGTTNASRTPVAVQGLPSGITSVSAGSSYVCALTSAGAALCWGNGNRGELGNDDEAISPLPVQVKGLTSGVTAISAGYYDACALEEDGGVVCWGFGGDGELGRGPWGPKTVSVVSAVPVAVKGLSGPAVGISSGAAPCAVTATGRVECWGITAETALTPVKVTGLGTGATAVTIGGGLSLDAFACAIDANRAIECWGGNEAGELGNSTTQDSPIPVLNSNIVNNATGVGASMSGVFACGIDSGLVMCWGANNAGQLGNGKTTTTPVSTPVSVEGLSGVAAVSAGDQFACALTTAGAVECWGNNTYGQLGNDSTTNSPVPVPVQGLGSGVKAIAAAYSFACALLADGTVDCWGNNNLGQLGNGSMKISLVPVPASGLSGVTAIAAGWTSACAVTSAGGISCWGDNTFGQLGNNTMTSSLVPVKVLVGLGVATRVAVGQISACAIVDGAALCWGYDYLGIGTSGYVLTPDRVVGLGSGVTDIAVGQGSSCAVVHGGVQCWGINTAGQLGNGGTVDEFQATSVMGFPVP